MEQQQTDIYSNYQSIFRKLGLISHSSNRIYPELQASSFQDSQIIQSQQIKNDQIIKKDEQIDARLETQNEQQEIQKEQQEAQKEQIKIQPIEIDDMPESSMNEFGEENGINAIPNFSINILSNYSESPQDEIQKLLDQNQTLKVIEMINKFKIDVNEKYERSNSALHYATKNSNFQLLDFLMSKNANINQLNSKGQSPLFIAVKYNDLQFCELLINYNADLNIQDKKGESILHKAAKKNFDQIIKAIVQNSKLDQLLKNKDQKIAEELLTTKESIKYFKKKQIVQEQHNISLNSFNLIGLIGKGSFGEVFIVEKKSSKKLYALKALQKKKIFEKHLISYIVTEKNILKNINHPFIVKLRFSFQTDCHLFMVIDLCQKGNLFQLLQRQKRLDEKSVKFYMAEVLLAIEEIHKQNIIYRDLKPENILLDQDGHAILADFGLAKENIVLNNTQSFCGTYAYLAPEMIKRNGHSKPVDWYSFGIVLYQLLTGQIPYFDKNRDVMFYNVLNNKLVFPEYLSATSQNIIQKLLEKDPLKRIGSLKGSDEIKKHNFFNGIDWNLLYQKQIKPPQYTNKLQIQKLTDNNIQGQSIQNFKVKNWSFAEINN